MVDIGECMRRVLMDINYVEVIFGVFYDVILNILIIIFFILVWVKSWFIIGGLLNVV